MIFRSIFPQRQQSHYNCQNSIEWKGNEFIIFFNNILLFFIDFLNRYIYWFDGWERYLFLFIGDFQIFYMTLPAEKHKWKIILKPPVAIYYSIRFLQWIEVRGNCHRNDVNIIFLASYTSNNRVGMYDFIL